MALIADSVENLQYNLIILKEELTKIHRQKINIGKTRTKKTHEIEQVGAFIEENGKLDMVINERMRKTGN